MPNLPLNLYIEQIFFKVLNSPGKGCPMRKRPGEISVSRIGILDMYSVDQVQGDL